MDAQPPNSNDSLYLILGLVVLCVLGYMAHVYFTEPCPTATCPECGDQLVDTVLDMALVAAEQSKTPDYAAIAERCDQLPMCKALRAKFGGKTPEQLLEWCSKDTRCNKLGKLALANQARLKAVGAQWADTARKLASENTSQTTNQTGS